MKNSILLGSVGSAVIATLIGIGAVVVQGGDVITLGETIATSVRLYQVAGMFGLLSIASFFVGLAYPVSTGTNVVNRSNRRGA